MASKPLPSFFGGNKIWKISFSKRFSYNHCHSFWNCTNANCDTHACPRIFSMLTTCTYWRTSKVLSCMRRWPTRMQNYRESTENIQLLIVLCSLPRFHISYLKIFTHSYSSEHSKSNKRQDSRANTIQKMYSKHVERQMVLILVKS